MTKKKIKSTVINALLLLVVISPLVNVLYGIYFGVIALLLLNINSYNKPQPQTQKTDNYSYQFKPYVD
jgi:predicted membrane protein